MEKMEIAFPNIGLYLHYVPKGFTIGNFTIAVYGMMLALGVLLGFMLANYEGNRVGLKKDIWWDFSVMAIICSVLGARTYYVIFSWDYYKDHLNEILNLRQGGIAIYGSIIGGFLALLIFCKIYKLSYFQMTDIGSMGLLVGQIVGRWGNFFNREVFGGYSDGLLAMRLPVEMVRARDITDDLASHMPEGVNYIQVHPTFLYEGGLNLFLLIGIWLYRKHKKFEGELTLLYVGGYGIIRFFVEGIRTDQLKIGHTNIAVSQMLGIVLFVMALVIEVCVRLYLLKKPKTSRK